MLPKRERLAREREIKGVIRTKQHTGRSPLLYLVAKDNNLQFSRIAVVAPKRLGNSVERNRIRRRLRAVFAGLKQKMETCVDLVVYPQGGLSRIGHGELVSSFMSALKKARLLDRYA